MVVLRSLATGLALTGAALASPLIQSRDATGGDAATGFVQGLVANATAAEQEHLDLVGRGLRTCKASNGLVVDLGYAKYQGYSDPSTGLNYWKGYVFLHRWEGIRHETGR